MTHVVRYSMLMLLLLLVAANASHTRPDAASQAGRFEEASLFLELS